MALTPVPSIDLESLPGEARSLIEILAERAQEADRLERENRLLREMLRLERLKKYGPKSEKLSEEQVELLELEPGVHTQEVEKEAEVSSGRSARWCRWLARRRLACCGRTIRSGRTAVVTKAEFLDALKTGRYKYQSLTDEEHPGAHPRRHWDRLGDVSHPCDRVREGHRHSCRLHRTLGEGARSLADGPLASDPSALANINFANNPKFIRKARLVHGPSKISCRGTR